MIVVEGRCCSAIAAAAAVLVVAVLEGDPSSERVPDELQIIIAGRVAGTAAGESISIVAAPSNAMMLKREAQVLRAQGDAAARSTFFFVALPA